MTIYAMGVQWYSVCILLNDWYKTDNPAALWKKQGKSEGFDSCDRPSNLTQIQFKSLIFQLLWPWYLMDDPKKFDDF